jgi:spore maturation protein CgeB
MSSILLIQSAGQHNGSTHLCKNDYLREVLSLEYAFIQNGWKPTVWGLRFPNFKDNIDFNSFDYILTLENYEMNWLPDFSKITKPIKIQWIIDLHFQKSEIYGQLTQYMDIVLHSTKSLINNFSKLYPKQKHIWFPNSFDERYFKPLNINKTKNIIFIGNVINRGELINYMKNKFNMKYFIKTGQDMINLINKTKINFNKSISCDVNYRNFETIACGTCLLTNYLPELEELGFKNKINCLMYKNINDIDNIIKYAFTDDNYITIAKNGLDLSINHTYTIRVKQLISNLTLNII